MFVECVGKRSLEVPKSSPLTEESVSETPAERNMMLGNAYEKIGGAAPDHICHLDCGLCICPSYLPLQYTSI